MCHSMGAGMFKDKPLHEFLKRIRAAVASSAEPPVGWITMKKENATMLLGTTLVIFRCVAHLTPCLSACRPVRSHHRTRKAWDEIY